MPYTHDQYQICNIPYGGFVSEIIHDSLCFLCYTILDYSILCAF